MKILHICNAYQTNSLYQELFDRIQKDNIDQVVVAPGYYKSGSECVNGVQVLYYFRKTGGFQRLFWKHKVNRITKYALSNVTISTVDIFMRILFLVMGLWLINCGKDIRYRMLLPSEIQI